MNQRKEYLEIYEIKNKIDNQHLSHTEYKNYKIVYRYMIDNKLQSISSEKAKIILEKYKAANKLKMDKIRKPFQNKDLKPQIRTIWFLGIGIFICFIASLVFFIFAIVEKSQAKKTTTVTKTIIQKNPLNKKLKTENKQKSDLLDKLNIFIINKDKLILESLDSWKNDITKFSKIINDIKTKNTILKARSLKHTTDMIEHRDESARLRLLNTAIVRRYTPTREKIEQIQNYLNEIINFPFEEKKNMVSSATKAKNLLEEIIK